MNNFWLNTNQPFFALAPMEDVTDTVFRELIMSVSTPSALNVVFTEFTNIDGLLNEYGRERVAERLIVSDTERHLLKSRGTKLVAQIWGNDPHKFQKVAEYLTSLNRFDGIDINMGCPVKKVVKKQTCSALIRFPDLAKDIVLATKSGTDLPVSVKTRIGFNSIDTETWIPQLLETKPAALTLHGRIQSQQSNGLANWNEIGKASAIRFQLNSDTKIIGNGDVESYVQGQGLIQKHKLDGIMVGRGVFKNPWMFNSVYSEPTVNDRFNLIAKHIGLYEKQWGCVKNFNILKRFFKIYINGFKGAAEIRHQLMESKDFDAANSIIQNTLNQVNKSVLVFG